MEERDRMNGVVMGSSVDRFDIFENEEDARERMRSARNEKIRKERRHDERKKGRNERIKKKMYAAWES